MSDKQYFGYDLEAMDFAINYHNWILEEFSPFFGDNVAEIGAGTGSFSKLILKRGISNLSLFEPSDNMFLILKENLSNIQNISLNNCYFEDKCNSLSNSFDSLCYVNVLEHIENEVDELSLAYKSIKTGGHILIFVPALSWLYSDLDKKLGHFRRYNMKNLKLVVENAGFKTVKINYFDLLGVAPWYLLFVLLKSEMKKNGVSFYDKFVIPFEKFFENWIKPPLGKNLLMIAKK